MAIRTVNPKDAYDKSKFVDAMKDLSDLEKYAQGLSSPENQWDPQIWEKLGKTLRNKPTFYADKPLPIVKKDLNSALSEYSEYIADYAKTNWSTMLDKIEGKSLVSLVNSLPLEETGNDELDKISKAIQELKKIEQYKESGDITGYINERMQNAERWRQETYYTFCSGNAEYQRSTFNEFAEQEKIEFSKAITKNKKLDEAKLKRLIDNSYKKFKSKYNPNKKGDKENDAIKNVLDAYHLAAAKEAYKKEK